MNLDHLNPPQREAVLHGDGPLLVLAGAGSGKTRVLTHRVARLIEEGACRPWEILAVTFTNKAAREMRERTRKLLGDAAEGLWVGTFHATCARILRRHAERVGLTPAFTIYDDDDQRRLIGQILKSLSLSERFQAREILSKIDRGKNAGQGPESLSPGDWVADVVARVWPIYEARLREEDAVDFNDILLRVLDLFEKHPEVAQELDRKFRYVLVDEFQDTNRVQYRLVDHLSSGWKNLAVVGDDDQSIYGWRGADVSNILGFADDHPGARVVKLEQNYRSTGMILGAANAVIARNPQRHPKTLWTARDGGVPIVIETADDDRVEADFIARTIRRLCAEDSRRTLSDFAVLYRTHAMSRQLEEAMRALKVPYVVVGGQPFYARSEVKDILAYLRVMANPRGAFDLERIINTPPRGIGDTTFDRVKAYREARAAGDGGRPRLDAENLSLLPAVEEPVAMTLLEAVQACAAGAEPTIAAAARKKLAAFVAMLEELRALALGGKLRLGDLAILAIEKSGYKAWLEGDGSMESHDRLDNLNELVSAIHAFESDHPGAVLSEFLESVALTGTADSADGVAKGEATLMTVHAAKGLEYPVVFIAGLEEGIFPQRREDTLAAEGEERRLCYVAMTRAMDRLILTHARQRRQFDEIRRNAPSVFLAEIPQEHLARRPAAAARASAGSGYGGFGRGAPQPRRGSEAAADEFDQRVDEGGGGGAGRSQPRTTLSGAGLRGAGGAGGAGATASVTYEYDQDDESFRVGARVRHSKFGEGTIRSFSGRGQDARLVIHFPGQGERTIVARFIEPAD
ncbi:MAG: UvrD-helicase domain-containing protein [Deltaproteobacteria bacterium]|nr:UvrD-helicase domain-containing protein [Deltaproteobacteria bacterium]